MARPLIEIPDPPCPPPPPVCECCGGSGKLMTDWNYWPIMRKTTYKDAIRTCNLCGGTGAYRGNTWYEERCANGFWYDIETWECLETKKWI